MTDQIKDLAEGLNKTAAEIKSELDNIKGDATKQGSEWNAKFDKMVADLTAKHDAIQAENAEVKAKAEALEAAVARAETSEKNSDEAELAERKKKFEDFLRTKSANKEELEIRSMSTDVNPDGGYLVYPELQAFMVTRQFETSPLRRVARTVQTGSKSIEVIIDDQEAGARWVDEGASGGETDTPKVGKLEIVAHKIEANPKMTTEMTQDPFMDVESWLQGKVSDQFSRTENTAFVSGNGVNKPKGFLSYTAGSSTYARDTIEQVNLGGATTLTADGLIELQNSLKEAYQGNAKFLTKRSSYADILKLKGNDSYFFGQTLLKDGQAQLQLLGKELIFADDMPAVASNALSVAYGDFGVGYTIVDRVGLTVLRDPYSSKGFVEFYTTKRTGGAVTNYEAIKIGKVAA